MSYVLAYIREMKNGRQRTEAGGPRWEIRLAAHGRDEVRGPSRTGDRHGQTGVSRPTLRERSQAWSNLVKPGQTNVFYFWEEVRGKAERAKGDNRHLTL